MSDTDVRRADPRVIRRLNVIIALLIVPYVFALDQYGGVLLQVVTAAVLVLAVVAMWYAIVPSRS